MYTSLPTLKNSKTQDKHKTALQVVFHGYVCDVVHSSKEEHKTQEIENKVLRK
jgi:hypothetical protein